MTARERRVVLLGVAVVAVAWIGLRLAPGAWQALRARQLQAARSSLALARERDLVLRSAEASRRRELLLHLRDSLIERTVSDCELTACVEEAQLQTEEAIADLPLTLSESTAHLDSLRAGHLRRVRVDLAVETDAAGLGELLRTLVHQSLKTELLSLQVDAADPSAASATERLRARVTIGVWASSEASD